MNEEQRQEQAGLHVLGLLTGDEAAAFVRALEKDAELRRLVAEFSESLRLLAESAPRVEPPPELRVSTLKAFRLEASQGVSGNAAPAPPPPPAADIPPGDASVTAGKRLRLFLPWAAAAGLAVAGLHLFNKNKELESAITAVQERAAARQTLAERRVSAAERSGAQNAAAFKTAEKALEETRQRERELAERAAALAKEVSALQDAASLDKTRIALLSSRLKARPNAVAATVWNQRQQDGLLVVENLPALARGRDYQLWVIDSAGGSPVPVSAGVFKVDEKGAVRLRFKPDQQVEAADKFAVTIEREGGSPVPTLTQLVVIGG